MQVAVLLRAFVPYGDDSYFPIWEAAAGQGLAVCLHDDGASAAEPAETPVGAQRYFAEKYAYTPIVATVHLSSLLTSGVFERLPALRVVLGTGGVDVARAMLWRIDKDWRSGRVEVPWVKRLPSLYAADHVRFVLQQEDGTVDGVRTDDELLRTSEAARMVVFGSRYPYLDSIDPRGALTGWPADARAGVLAANALEAMPRLASAAALSSEEDA